MDIELDGAVHRVVNFKIVRGCNKNSRVLFLQWNDTTLPTTKLVRISETCCRETLRCTMDDGVIEQLLLGIEGQRY